MPENGNPDSSGSPPGKTDGEISSGEMLTISKAELNTIIEGRLRGSGKELKKAHEIISAFEKEKADREAAAEEARRKKMAEDGEKDQLLQLERDEKTKIQEQLDAMNAKEASRISRLDEKNKSRIGALPEELRDLAPPGLTPDDLSDFLDRLESKIVNTKIPVAGVGGARMNGAPLDPMERAKQIGHNFLFGKRKQ